MSSSASFPSSTSTTTLCPGYKHVEEFGPDEEYEEEEQVDEFYVTLDLGAAEPMLIPSSSTYRLIGLDTPTPFLQLSGTILQGRHESLLGSELLFTEAKDTQDRSKRHLSFTSTTSQRIRFKEVLLKPKGVPATEVENDVQMETEEDADTEMVEKPKRRRSRKKTAGDGDAAGDASTTEKAPGKKSTRKVTTTATGKGKGKGKAKAVEGEDEEMQIDEPGPGKRKRKGKAKAVEGEHEGQEDSGVPGPGPSPIASGSNHPFIEGDT